MISVVVPVFNEADNIAPLIAEIAAVSVQLPISEIIYVDDASSDGSSQILKNLRANYPALRVIRHGTRSGQSASLLTGVKAAGNELIITIDGDGQNDPADMQRSVRR